MSKKEMFKKQNERNRLRRKNKEKLLATLLTSGLLTCAINAQPVLANTLEPSIDTASIQSRASSATIEKQTVVIRISGSELIISEEEGTITIPREVIETKIIPNITVKSCVMSIIFSDQSYLSDQVSVKITKFFINNVEVDTSYLEVTTINNKDKVEDDEIVDDSITDSVIDKDNTIITTSPNTNSSAVSSNTITANTSVNLKLFLYILI